MFEVEIRVIAVGSVELTSMGSSAVRMICLFSKLKAKCVKVGSVKSGEKLNS